MTGRLPLEEEMLARLRPTADEKAHICAIAEKILAAVSKSGKAEGMVVGSIARHTWLRGDHDLDVFMLFDPSLTREELEEQGLSLARRSRHRLPTGSTKNTPNTRTSTRSSTMSMSTSCPATR